MNKKSKKKQKLNLDTIETSLSLGKRLKQARKKAGFTQEELLEYIYEKYDEDYTIQAMSKWENNHNKANSLNVYYSYHEISGFSFDYITGKSDEEFLTQKQEEQFYNQEIEDSNEWLKEEILKATVDYINKVTSIRICKKNNTKKKYEVKRFPFRKEQVSKKEYKPVTWDIKDLERFSLTMKDNIQHTLEVLIDLQMKNKK